MAHPALTAPRPLLWLLTLTLLALTGCAGNPGIEGKTTRAVIGGQTFTLELALDDATRYQGLSDRRSIDELGGMIFVFPKPETVSFVMRRCYVPIDILFLDGSGRVVRAHEMQVEPYETPDDQLKRYSSHWPAQFAVELRGGTIKRLDVREGQRVELPTRELIRLAH